MIDHDLRCIFVHIPRTAGSSVERWLCGSNWWKIDPPTKHLTARQSRALYAPYWDDYFKFSMVRHPVTRVQSLLCYGRFYGLALRPDMSIDFSGYFQKFGQPITVEHDRRFFSRDQVAHKDHRAGTIYGNILDCELDFIARYETLDADMARVRAQLGVSVSMKFHIEKSIGPKPEVTDPATLLAIRTMYSEDFETFGYSQDP